MTTPTPHGQVPEALYAAAMEFAAEKASIAYVQRKCRCSYNDAERMLERMVNEGFIETYSGRKSATTAQPAEGAANVQNPAEIEHVAGDVSKNGAEVNMSTQQPAPAGATPLPLLVRDIAADFGVTPVQVCLALLELGFGHLSVNMAITPKMAEQLREHFAATPQPAPATQQAGDEE